jgi:vesicle-fusing ATPase
MTQRDALGLGAMTPGLSTIDPQVAYWLAQVNLRLRRELAWCWYQRTGENDPETGVLPPFTGVADDVLSWSRSDGYRRHFFEQDGTAVFLTHLIQGKELQGEQLQREQFQTEQPALVSQCRGDWSWLVKELELSEAAQFTLALAIAYRVDAGIGPVCAAAQNDTAKAYPTLALAQRLWDQPEAMLPLASIAHPLRCLGLLSKTSADWHQLLDTPAWLAAGLQHGYQNLPGVTLISSQLEDSQLEPSPFARAPYERACHEKTPHEIIVPQWEMALHALKEYSLNGSGLSSSDMAGSNLSGSNLSGPGLKGHQGQLCRIPMLGGKEDSFTSHCAAISGHLQALLVTITPAAWQQNTLSQLLTWCWLTGVEPVLPWGAQVAADHWPLALPLRVWQPMSKEQYKTDEAGMMLPLELPATDFYRRLEVLEECLGSRVTQYMDVVEECARRFRFSEPVLRRIATCIKHRGPWQGADLVEACRNETRGELAQITQQVFPRFDADELVLAPEQEEQFSEVSRAMDALTQVHYRWGTARVWNESGLAVLFCGPPGTGKTMAAEALATRLKLDMYRVDLAQVVSKYVGETEKNLRRIFDAAEASDCLLFFDESDALFGKRTEVKDAHDRYANIEVSYLLERMERFKGLAILASNRRKDMDEAFLRRLRYIIEFPVPGVEERERIWRMGFPENVDTSDLNFRFLARQFAFSGGHIRSVIFNACLQTAAKPELQPAQGKVGRPSMRQVLLQVRRELQKLNRSADEELFGNYAKLLREVAA